MAPSHARFWSRITGYLVPTMEMKKDHSQVEDITNANSTKILNDTELLFDTKMVVVFLLSYICNYDKHAGIYDGSQ